MDEIDWSADGAPRSRRYDDVYFSREDGLAESRAVFLQGCGLPEAWAGRRRFQVAELGFGTGLNVLALLQLWRASRPAHAALRIFSVEAHPLTPEDADRALSAWPELADLARPLLAAWPQAVGAHRVEWPELNATLDVVVAEAAEALAGWDGVAEAWFLDGFAPSRNPEMWREQVLALVAARSAPGARLATFTVAGAVRRGLEAQGFALARRPGYGRKRERLEGTWAGRPGPTLLWLRRPGSTSEETLIIGGGIAGAALARALRALGVPARLLDTGDGGASGNPAALVMPRLELGDNPGARLHAQAFARAALLYEQIGGAILSKGVRQLGGPDAGERFARLAESLLYAPGGLSAQIGPGGEPELLMRRACVVDPARVIGDWLTDIPRTPGRTAALVREDGCWTALDASGACLARASNVVVAAGACAAALLPGLPLRPVRGQVSLAPGLEGPAAAWGGYCAPTPAGLLFGATHDREQMDETVRREDHARNLETLRLRFPALAEAAEAGPPLLGRAGVRATTPDRLPLAGPVPKVEAVEQAFGGAELSPAALVQPGLWVLGGLGSRGFTTAPLLAEHVAAWITGAASPLPLALGEAVHPSRFIVRDFRRRSGRSKLTA